ncbi:tRNA (guanosine(46)-N7)-methyltransferase TrmB [Roseofilum casamattae]|uniref:tRNA (guanine-N(7)-)-methyltransferase n=1 Tax=Roseofilum casamattae BLCC-M143 TaxID=3022442 RepID=A0ABT7BXP0_9CYAN|nr:tRNA (guanosine(46)-N7)-methyltransferase TrmB [Roseofilum casamattae]MDJ1183941.1 tRNA (guanosine(46)-N7)-methyltransferase TrmB [Roseofilum casamattae BLCC-M143]
MGRVRVRQHVNPLSQKFQVPASIPQWEEIYHNLNRPLHLDIGCGRGRFLFKMAQVQLDWNFLGLEIRKPLVEEANEWRDRESLNNLHYLFCNANISLENILSSIGEKCLHYVTIQFPDPWFKVRHQKRRMVQEELVETISKFLIDEGTVLLQSDVEEVAIEMREIFDRYPQFSRSNDWLEENPLPVSTEREIATYNKGEIVYRVVFQHLSR